MPGFWQRQIILLPMVIGALVALSPNAVGDQARIAVAANFKICAEELGRTFSRASGHQITFSYGSTGQLFAQISQGAPYDAFLSADQARAARAAADELAIAETRFTYAYGHLAIYSRETGRELSIESLAHEKVAKIAIANPRTAPYGAAALQMLEQSGTLPHVREKLVRGTNVAQAFQFAFTGNADLAIVAQAQIARQTIGGSWWPIPSSFHDPIAQDAILLNRGEKNAAAKSFLAFLKGTEAQAIIASSGYSLAGGPSGG